ncbi:MAG: hypothetical protein K2L51_04485 [Clostridiales bacterium]|nr:hypothetical protein [Clostridiales bacterium]
MADENKKEQEQAETQESAPAAEKQADEGEKAIAQVTPRRRKRNGKYISRLEQKDLDALQKRKSLFMYLSTLFFAVSLFLKVEGRTRLSQNKELFAVFTLYVIAEVALIVLTVYVALMSRGGQKIGRELKERNVPQGGLDHHTFWSYEIFNAVHIALAIGEIAVSVYKFGAWGACNIAVSVASAVCCFLSRQILFKANAGNLEFLPGRETE